MTKKSWRNHNPDQNKIGSQLKRIEKQLINTAFSPSESQIQCSFIDYVDKVHPDLRDCFIKLDNEGKTSWHLGKIKKREGKRKGAADLLFSHATIAHHGLWMEFKTEEGKVSAAQKEFGRAQTAKGYAYVVVRSVDEAIIALQRYLAGALFTWE